ncbi:2-dehydro-3-deoxygalactonokinase [Flavihumibacter petaseus]|uniref:Putative 2-dehydro-3-deoxygalactonokinase n=1 Tax=Flavihumibacter petaseus NBRC 106054 TaxID=1220578 RepID=A0A0E9N601_9BACT|nr:2-dehydro-3-deoxygalactonokinase [Flavihumibacter petaseus]GAO45126.1 putative 2-dehydro-3-deoxygalactonokinase [Flavihumibacter petaseus NBRC 106054]
MTTKILCCDWGNTNFRLYLADRTDQAILATYTSNTGIRLIHQPSPVNSAPYGLMPEVYRNHLLHAIKSLETEVGFSLTGLPLVVSGMASSPIGIQELAYTALPFSLEHPHLVTLRYPESDAFRHTVLLVSGLTTGSDIMRGEETKIIGAATLSAGRELFILPGTHSKHAVAEGSVLTGFQTFLTGEFFSLLQSHGILAASIDADTDLLDHLDSFKEAVLRVQEYSLLSLAFEIRANDVLKRKNKKDNYWWLSGLLIGEELKAIRNDQFDRITLVGGSIMEPLYRAAMEFIGMAAPDPVSAEYALIRGQIRIFNGT